MGTERDVGTGTVSAGVDSGEWARRFFSPVFLFPPGREVWLRPHARTHLEEVVTEREGVGCGRRRGKVSPPCVGERRVSSPMRAFCAHRPPRKQNALLGLGHGLWGGDACVRRSAGGPRRKRKGPLLLQSGPTKKQRQRAECTRALAHERPHTTPNAKRCSY